MRYPFLVNLQQSLHALDQFFSIERGQAGTLSGAVHSDHVQIGTEYSNFAIDTSVSFHAFEELKYENINNWTKYKKYYKDFAKFNIALY